jgi:hypothetical protein
MEEQTTGTLNFFTAQVHNVQMMAAFASVLLSLLLLAVYRAAVLRSMRRRAAPLALPASADTIAAPSSASVPIELHIGDGVQSSQRTLQLAQQALAGPWRNLLVYAIAGLTFAVAMSGLYIASEAGSASWAKLAWLILQNASPLALTATIVKSFSWRTSALLVVAALCATILPEMLNEDYPELMAGIYVPAATVANFGALVVAYIALLRPIRAIGPMVYVFMSAVLFGFVAFGRGISDPEHTLRDAYLSDFTTLFARLGIDASWAPLAILLSVLAIFALLGWFVQRALGALYTTGRISDQSLMIDLVWLSATIASGAHLAGHGLQWIAYALGVFLLYKLVAMAGFALLRRGRPDEKAPGLLHLRVFALGKQSRDLFEAFSEPWRFAGRTQMIAGPDLAGSTVEPHEFLEFLSGNLSRRFIADDAGLERRLAESRTARDHDGRLRVADFFCHDDTWQHVLKRLVRENDAVLMDLRGFGPANKGCIFEIRELLAILPLDRIVLVVGKETDLKFLQNVLEEGLASLPPLAVNRGATRVTVFQLLHRRDVKKLLVAVAGAVG